MNHFTFLRTAALMGWDALREGRLSLSPRRWLVDLRHLRRVMQNARSRDAGLAISRPEGPAERRRRPVTESDGAALAAFLHSASRLSLDTASSPVVSILLVLFNRADLTFRCLSSIAAHVRTPFEVVIVDNNSADGTARLLDRIDGARVARSGRNVGFLAAANAAAHLARGTYLLLLNNDTELLPGSVESAVRTLEGSASIGAVGGRLMLPDGSLQEAGGIIWNDGSCQGYGRGESPFASPFLFQRDVDFCSAAFLLTPRELFYQLGGFEEVYRPAYYEDADYCVKVWKAGRRVVYDPGAMVLHYEFGSSSPDTAIAMQTERRSMFRERHGAWLAAQSPPGPDHVLRARDRSTSGLRILVFDDRRPDRRAGFGFPRAADLLKALVHLGHSITLYPTAVFADPPDDAGAEVPRTVEVAEGYGPRRIRAFLDERRGYYDCIIVSRSHNLQLLRGKLGPPAEWSPGASVVYDAEAIAAAREAGRRRLAGERIAEHHVAQMIAEELELARGVNAVMTVSEAERDQFVGRGWPNVHVAGLALTPCPTPRPFHERTGLLFVGSFAELSPNEDAVRWFVAEVLPLLRTQLGLAVRLVVVGQNAPPAILNLRSEGVDVCSGVTDLEPFYDRARVFVAPTRFAAGVPYKVAQAAAHGLPVVCTPLLSGQLGWEAGRDVLAHDSAAQFADACATLYSDPERWAELRGQALARVTSEHSWDRLVESVRLAIDAAGTRRETATAAPVGRPRAATRA